jgi:hypothetical protein
VIDKWEFNDYEVQHLTEQNWTGPRFDKYIVNHYVLGKTFKKKLASNFPNHKKINSCIIILDAIKKNQVYEFDKCKTELKRAR